MLLTGTKCLLQYVRTEQNVDHGCSYQAVAEGKAGMVASAFVRAKFILPGLQRSWQSSADLVFADTK
jgi:hypothetical protein